MSDDVEVRAKDMGWVPEESYKGSAPWVGAEEFVRRGEEILPLLRKNNAKLLGELNGVRGELTNTQQTLQGALQSLEEFKQYHEADSKRQYERALSDLKKEKREAIKAGDHEGAADLEEAIDTLREEAAKPTTKKAETPPQPVDHSKDPVFVEWREENPWYGVDKEKTVYAESIGEFLRKTGSPLKHREFLDRITEEVDNRFNDTSSRRSPSKVEGSKGSSEQRGGTHSYNDLPPEAKQACDRFGEKLVGDNRAFKKLEDWRKKYVSDYFGAA